MSRVQVGCGATVLYTVGEWEFLATLPAPSAEVEPLHWCELEPAHGGRHFCFGQQSGEEEWWMAFDVTDPARELRIVPGCRAVAAEAGAFGDCSLCTLAAGHVGGHSFDFGCGDGSADRLEPVLLPVPADPAAFTAVQRHNRAVLAEAGLTVEAFLEMESLQHQEDIFGVVSTRHFAVQTSVAVPQLARLDAATPGLSAAVALDYLAVLGRPPYPPLGGDTLLVDSAYVSLTDTGRDVLVRVAPQLQD